MGLTPKFFDADQLNAQRDKLQTPSEVVFREVGVWGVAEGAALAGAGPKSNLLVPKQKTARATIAVAVTEGMTPIMTNDAKPQGKMTLLGLGPGDPGWRAAATGDIIQNATDLVGYSYYIDQVEPLSASQTRHDFALGEEEKRCAFALDLRTRQERRLAMFWRPRCIRDGRTIVRIDRSARRRQSRMGPRRHPGSTRHHGDACRRREVRRATGP